MTPGSTPTIAPPTAIPSTRTLLTSLISQLSEATSTALAASATPPAPSDGGSLLSSLPPTTQQLLLTLHCILPSALLPALGLLDRRLVTRYTLTPSATTPPQSIYYVHSAAPNLPSGPGKFHSTPTARYEVRTQAWNCTCASFAFAACKATRSKGGDEVCIWGGYSRGEAPVCKHLLACVLAENCGVLAGFLVREEVDAVRLAELAVLWD